MANMLSNFLPQAFWKDKIAPKFKFIDFREFHEVVAIWASKIVTQYWADPANNVSVSQGGTQDPTTTQCPLTLQELGLILRNEIMFIFGATQVGVQSLLPILPQSSTENVFHPFLMGNTGTAVQSYKMKLPLPLIENLRGLLVHIVTSASGRDHEVLCPVLGQYQNDVPVTSDYQFTTYDAETPVVTDTFAALPPVQRRLRKGSKGELMWERDMVEPVIDFIDTSSGSNYVFINDPTRLTTLTSLWNEWVTKYEAYSSPIGVLSNNPGVNVLCSINQTRYWINVTPAAKARAADVLDERVVQRKNLSTSIYANRQTFAVSFSSPHCQRPRR